MEWGCLLLQGRKRLYRVSQTPISLLWLDRGIFVESLDIELFEWQQLTQSPLRFPRQHVRIRRRPRPSQGRDRPGRHSRGQERTSPPACPHMFIKPDTAIQQVIIKWRGKPVFIRHRTEDEIKEAEDIDWNSLRDPQPDSDRVQKPEWLIMLGSSTLLTPCFVDTARPKALRLYTSTHTPII